MPSIAGRDVLELLVAVAVRGVRGLSAWRTEKNATIEASRSIAEWIASVRIATEPVTAPATSLSTISAEFEPIESAAAREREPWPCGQRPASHAAASRAARPRCEIAVLLRVGELGHRARPSPSAGTKTGS